MKPPIDPQRQRRINDLKRDMQAAARRVSEETRLARITGSKINHPRLRGDLQELIALSITLESEEATT